MVQWNACPTGPIARPATIFRGVLFTHAHWPSLQTFCVVSHIVRAAATSFRRGDGHAYARQLDLPGEISVVQNLRSALRHGSSLSRFLAEIGPRPQSDATGSVASRAAHYAAEECEWAGPMMVQRDGRKKLLTAILWMPARLELKLNCAGSVTNSTGIASVPARPRNPVSPVPRHCVAAHLVPERMRRNRCPRRWRPGKLLVPRSSYWS
jgi:hypothetical protein